MNSMDKTPLDLTLEDRGHAGRGGPCYGVYCALVTDIVDDDNLGRVKVKLAALADAEGEHYEAWARVATLMAGADRGSFFMPDVHDEVLVAFEDGDPRRPYVIGGLWNGKDKPPARMDGAGKNEKKVLRSRNGVKVTLDDKSGQETLTLETPGGPTVVLKNGPSAIEISDGNGNSIKFGPSGISITATAKLSIDAPKLDVSAGMVGVSAGMSTFSGVVKSDTLIATSVVGTTYTPGAGNIW